MHNTARNNVSVVRENDCKPCWPVFTLRALDVQFFGPEKNKKWCKSFVFLSNVMYGEEEWLWTDVGFVRLCCVGVARLQSVVFFPEVMPCWRRLHTWLQAILSPSCLRWACEPQRKSRYSDSTTADLAKWCCFKNINRASVLIIVVLTLEEKKIKKENDEMVPKHCEHVGIRNL